MDKSMISETLSLWEVAHRWAGEEHIKSNDDVMSYAVKDSLRFMVRNALNADLGLATRDGELIKANYYMPPLFEWFDEVLEEDEKDDEEARQDALERYNQYVIEKLKPHNREIQGFDEALQSDYFSKELFDNKFVFRGMLIRCCLMHGVEPPQFWTTPELIEIEREWLEENPGGVEQQEEIYDREICRALAQTFWMLDESMLLSAIYKHPAFQQFGNARLYSYPTIRKWIRDLEPALDKE